MDRPRKPPSQPSLDEIVSQNAAIIADQIQEAAAWAKSEMDLQVEVAGALKEFARQAKINPLEGHHNVTIATGRPDSVYGGVIIEYKDPGTLSPNKDAAPNRAVIEQLKRRFYDMNREERRNWPSMFGVATDGKYFIFLRFRDDKWTDQEPLEVDGRSTERFLWALYNLGQKGKPYRPEYLQGDFGSESLVARDGVRALYEEILKTENPKAQVFFNQWKILFGEVCGYDVENLTDKLKKLAESYGVKGKPQPAQFLFALHTYYAILIKLLAAEVVSFFNPWMTRQVERLQSATSSSKLRKELEDLERGGVFHEMGITNFLEGDLFAWYLAVWSEPIEALVRKMISKLDDYNPGTFSEEPAQSRDLLKKLYQQLFPKSVRHDLGEYYTPDWLAEHVLNELGYEGDPDKRILDPACGSGTFLVMAINRIRQWYDLNREKCAYDEGELLKKILSNVIGFDLNPLAVMAARTNYLVAIKGLIRHVDHVEIPVYLCDSIMTPAEYGDLFTGGSGKVAKVPCSAMKPPHLLVPKEIAHSPGEVAKYADVLESCIMNAYAPQEFLSRCRDEGLNITAADAHMDLYSELVKLDKANKNGIWARIIKNNFAPLFVGSADYVAGNPPWINWESLPAEYRHVLKPLWHRYGLFTLSGAAGRLGGGKKDLSMLFVYGAADHYLEAGGRLGFVITQTVFKTRGAGDGFRRFNFAQGGDRQVLRPVVVHDLSSMQVFEGATNRTAVFVCEKQTEDFRYPVPYIAWSGGSRMDPDQSLRAALTDTRRTQMQAVPVEPSAANSPWLTVRGTALAAVQRVIGRSDYQAFEGVNTGGLNGCYWVRILEKRRDSPLLIENMFDVGKIKVERVRTSIEPDLVYPLLRGRDVQRWCANASAHIILTQDPRTRQGIPAPTMRRSHEKTYAYLLRFEARLRKRASSSVRGLMDHGPFYSMFAVGPYTMAPWKVLWPEVGHTVRAAVCGPQKVDSEKPVLPDHTLIAVSCGSGQEAHYLCALLNSSPAQCAAAGYIVLHPSPHIMEHISIPRFSPGDRTHRRLSELSKACHATVDKDDAGRIDALEAEIDKAAAKLWGISDDELKAIQGAMAETRGPTRGADRGENGDEP